MDIIRASFNAGWNAGRESGELAYMYIDGKLVDFVRVEAQRSFVERVHPDDTSLGRVSEGPVEPKLLRVQRFSRIGDTNRYELET